MTGALFHCLRNIFGIRFSLASGRRARVYRWFTQIRKLPVKLRRLTKAEAERLGVSHKAKRRVDASLKTITKRTKLYTDRTVAEAKLNTSKEKYSKYRHTVGKHGQQIYRNVKPSEHARLAHLAYNKKAQIIASGPKMVKSRWEGSAFNEKGKQQYPSPGLNGGELRTFLDQMYLPRGFLGYNDKNPPTEVQVIIYKDYLF